MKATITSTDQIVEIDAPAANPVERMARPGAPIMRRVMARAWEGLTEGGVRFTAYIPIVQVHKDDDNSQFERESKGGTRALPFLPMYRSDRDAYAATLTTLDDRFSEKWERAAPLPGDRIKALRKFHEAGIFTWVSLEPTLDVEASLAIVDATREFVDLYKVGRANYVPTITKVIDWRDYTLRMIDRLNRWSKLHYIKLDLQPFLPNGYVNPLRVPQHH